MSRTRHGLVTVGAGQAAVSAVRLLRRRGFDEPIAMVSAERHMPYQRPPLSKEFLAGDQVEDDLTLLDDTWCAANDVDLRLDTTAEHVAPGRVRLAGGEGLDADAVLLATGARARSLPDVAGERVVVLRTVDDAIRLRSLLATTERLVVVGGGLIGSEVASVARTRGIDTVVLEAGELPMLSALGRPMAEVYARMHRERGVALHGGVVVHGVQEARDGVLVATSAGSIAADLVLVAVGATPDDTVARASGLGVDPHLGGVLVDDVGRTDAPGVYAAGDVATRRTGPVRRHEHVEHATAGGTAIARELLSLPASTDDVPWFWSDQYDLGLQFVGRPRADAQVVVRGDVENLDFTAFYLADGLVHAGFSVDRGGDVPVIRQLVSTGVPVEPDALVDEDLDLFDLLDSVTS